MTLRDLHERAIAHLRETRRQTARVVLQLAGIMRQVGSLGGGNQPAPKFEDVFEDPDPPEEKPKRKNSHRPRPPGLPPQSLNPENQ